MESQSLEPVQPCAEDVRLARVVTANLTGGDHAVAGQTETRARTARALDEPTALSEEMGLYGE